MLGVEAVDDRRAVAVVGGDEDDGVRPGRGEQAGEEGVEVAVDPRDDPALLPEVLRLDVEEALRLVPLPEPVLVAVRLVAVEVDQPRVGALGEELQEGRRLPVEVAGGEQRPDLPEERHRLGEQRDLRRGVRRHLVEPVGEEPALGPRRPRRREGVEVAVHDAGREPRPVGDLPVGRRRQREAVDRDQAGEAQRRDEVDQLLEEGAVDRVDPLRRHAGQRDPVEVEDAVPLRDASRCRSRPRSPPSSSRGSTPGGRSLPGGRSRRRWGARPSPSSAGSPASPRRRSRRRSP